MHTKNIIMHGIAAGCGFVFLVLGANSGALAAPISVFQDNGWTRFASDDAVGENGFVNPGWGGQAFDAEYLFYKKSGNQLSIGLQTGFNVETGVVKAGQKNYYAGDLALSFDGDASVYEYAFDFGLETHPYDPSDTDLTHDQGLYEVISWNKGVYYDASLPFAMEQGKHLEDGKTEAGLEGDSYYRIVSFDLTSLNLSHPFDGFSAHWTMSCGNDVVEGTAPVPEPATMLLFGTGLAGLASVGRKKMKCS